MPYTRTGTPTLQGIGRKVKTVHNITTIFQQIPLKSDVLPILLPMAHKGDTWWQTGFHALLVCLVGLFLITFIKVCLC